MSRNEKEILETKVNENRLKIAQQLASMGNWELDLKTNALYWSDEIFNIFEIDQSKFGASYDAFLNAIHPDDRELVNEAYLNSLKTREKYTIQHRLLMQDGTVKYVEEKCESYFDDKGEPYISLGTVQDITEQKETEHELKKTLSFLKGYQEVLDASNIVTKSDLNGNITYVNDKFCKITGYSEEEAIGKPHNIIRHPNNPKSLYKEMWATIQSKKTWQGTLKNKGKLDDYWVDLSILPILDENDEIVEYIAVRHEITQMVKQQEKLDTIANTDTLTNLGSRYKLLNDIENSSDPALAIINLDKFSQINDFYGHKIGDSVIQQFARKLSEFDHDFDCNLYHLQGDEFVILHPNTSKGTFLEKLSEIEGKLREIKILLAHEEISLDFSTAVSFEPKYQLLQTADMALKIAKNQNKSLIIYTDEISLNKEYENNLKWTTKIIKAIETDNIIPFFQPIVNNENNHWEKYESLVRLVDDEKIISPFFFLDIAKQTKQYSNITKVMIEKTVLAFKDLDKGFSINLTVDDILNNGITSYIISILEKYDVGPRIVFEIVESESIEVFDEVINFIEKVKQLGCKIAIDDFGTGYSNFEYLVKLKADYIKIDGSLIKNIDTNRTSYLVVKNIVQFSKDLGMKTIAEYVENESIFLMVKELGIDYSQGYFFSKPQPSI